MNILYHYYYDFFSIPLYLFTPIFTPFFLASRPCIDCRLTTLKLGWNSIKMASSWDIAKSLSVNQTLLYLDLSYNGLGQTTGTNV